jgi:hypothetical protein
MRPVGAELFHANGQTDTSKLIVAFRNFANAPRNSIFCPLGVFLCVLYGPENKQLLPSTMLTDWFCCNKDRECLLRGTKWIF